MGACGVESSDTVPASSAFPKTAGTMTTPDSTPTDPTQPTPSTPPLSTVPPPQLTPTGRLTFGPSDNFKPRTITGRAVRGLDGCVQLTSGSITWHLTGQIAEEALVQSSVIVTGLPGQGLRRDCGEPQLVVSKVVPTP